MKSKYKRIKLQDGSTRDEHRLVMERHLGRKLTFDEVVHHKDGNPRNNILSNLELMSRSEHSQNHWNTNMIKKGEKHGRSKLTENDVIKIKNLINSGTLNFTKIGEIFEVSKQTISKIKNKEIWKHV